MLLYVLFFVLLHMPKWVIAIIIINPRRMPPEGYGSCPVCVSVCLSVRNLNLGTGASRGLNEGTSE